jgi:hypothetical protein
VGFLDTNLINKFMRDNDSLILESLYCEMSQKYGSAKTSIPQIAATFKSKYFDTPSGSINVDLGGGKYDIGTDYLKEKGIINLIIDPYNRSEEFNQRNEKIARENKVASVTVNSVLNVIMEPEERENVIKKAKSFLNDGGKAFFLIHYKKGEKARETKENSWQNHMHPREYLPEIQQYFDNVVLKGNLIIAS